MVGWLIVGGIICLLVVMLWMPGVLRISYQEQETIVRFSYCGISIYDSQRAPKQRKLRKKRSNRNHQKKRQSVSEADKQKKEKKQSLREQIAFWKPILGDILHGLRWLWKGISIRQLKLYIAVGRFDAKDCALAYGTTNQIVYQTLGFFKSFFTIKKEDIRIRCVFGQEETTYTLQFCMKLRLAAVLAAGLSFFLSMLVRMVREQWQHTAQQQRQKGEVQHEGNASDS